MPEIPENEKLLLESLGFKPDSGYPKIYNIQVDEDTIASVDYRKVNGRRSARRKGSFVDDPDEIEILKKFKEEKDKLQSSSIERQPARNILDTASGAVETTAKRGTHDTSQSSGRHDLSSSKDAIFPAHDNLQSSSTTTAGSICSGTPDTSRSLNQHNGPEETKDSSGVGGGLQNRPPIPPITSSPANQIYDFIFRLTGNSILEVSGRSGFGKTKLLLALADLSLKAGKKVVFIDTEQNLDEIDIIKFGNNYRFLPTLKEVISFVQKEIPRDIDIVFLDSLGAEQNGMWGVWNDLERNRGLSEIASTAYLLKMWAIKNKKIVIVTNQPKSERGKKEEEKKEELKNKVFVPMETVGDKHAHIIKTAIYLDNIWMNKEPPTGGKKTTRSWVKALKCRQIGRGKELFLIDISDDGIVLSAFDNDRIMKYFSEKEIK